MHIFYRRSTTTRCAKTWAQQSAGRDCINIVFKYRLVDLRRPNIGVADVCARSLQFIKVIETTTLPKSQTSNITLRSS